MRKLAANLLVIALLPVIVLAFLWWFACDWAAGRKIGEM